MRLVMCICPCSWARAFGSFASNVRAPAALCAADQQRQRNSHQHPEQRPCQGQDPAGARDRVCCVLCVCTAGQAETCLARASHTACRSCQSPFCAHMALLAHGKMCAHPHANLSHAARPGAAAAAALAGRQHGEQVHDGGQRGGAPQPGGCVAHCCACTHAYNLRQPWGVEGGMPGLKWGACAASSALEHLAPGVKGCVMPGLSMLPRRSTCTAGSP